MRAENSDTYGLVVRETSLKDEKSPAMCRVKGSFLDRRKNMCKGPKMANICVFEEVKESFMDIVQTMRVSDG